MKSIKEYILESSTIQTSELGVSSAKAGKIYEVIICDEQTSDYILGAIHGDLPKEILNQIDDLINTKKISVVTMATTKKQLQRLKHGDIIDLFYNPDYKDGRRGFVVICINEIKKKDAIPLDSFASSKYDHTIFFSNMTEPEYRLNKVNVIKDVAADFKKKFSFDLLY